MTLVRAAERARGRRFERFVRPEPTLTLAAATAAAWIAVLVALFLATALLSPTLAGPSGTSADRGDAQARTISLDPGASAAR